MNCPNCGKEILDEQATYCPYCAKPLIPPAPAAKTMKRTGFPIAAGILTILAACVSFIIGFLFGFTGIIAFLILGILDILAFAFGLTGGMFSLERTHFPLVIFGISFLLSSMVVSIILLRATAFAAFQWGVWFLFSLPIIILSILGLIFAAISKREFV